MCIKRCIDKKRKREERVKEEEGQKIKHCVGFVQIQPVSESVAAGDKNLTVVNKM